MSNYTKLIKTGILALNKKVSGTVKDTVKQTVKTALHKTGELTLMAMGDKDSKKENSKEEVVKETSEASSPDVPDMNFEKLASFMLSQIDKDLITEDGNLNLKGLDKKANDLAGVFSASLNSLNGMLAELEKLAEAEDAAMAETQGPVAEVIDVTDKLKKSPSEDGQDLEAGVEKAEMSEETGASGDDVNSVK